MEKKEKPKIKKSERTSKKEPESKNRKEMDDNYGNVIRGYDRTMFLKDFADAGRIPIITDVEVVVCFADLRGFTNYVHNLQKIGQDNQVQHFLKSYFQIFPKAILKSV